MLTGRAGMKVVGLWKVEICYVKKRWMAKDCCRLTPEGR